MMDRNLRSFKAGLSVFLLCMFWCYPAMSQAPELPIGIHSLSQCEAYYGTCAAAQDNARRSFDACESDYFRNDHKRVSGNLGKYQSEWIRTVRFESCPDDDQYAAPKCDGQAERYCSIKHSCAVNNKACKRIAAASEDEQQKQRQLRDAIQIVNPVVESFASNGTNTVADIVAPFVSSTSPVKMAYETKMRVELAHSLFTLFQADSSQQDRLSALTGLGIQSMDASKMFKENAMSTVITQIAADTVISHQFQSMNEVERAFAEFDSALNGGANETISAYHKDVIDLNSPANRSADLLAMLKGDEIFDHIGNSVSASSFVQLAALEERYRLAEERSRRAEAEIARLDQEEEARKIESLRSQLESLRAEDRARQDRLRQESDERVRKAEERRVALEEHEWRRQQEAIYEEGEARRQENERSRSSITDSVRSILDTYNRSHNRSTPSPSSGGRSQCYQCYTTGGRSYYCDGTPMEGVCATK
jgi:hypothetical protein